MARTLLLIRPVLGSHEDLLFMYYEAQSFSLGLLVKQISVKRGYRVVDLPGSAAQRSAFEYSITSFEEIDLIVFLGHGSYDGSHAIGYGPSPMIDETNISLVAGKGLYFLCSHVGKALGDLAVNLYGASFFIGFRNQFHLVGGGAESIVAECALAGLEALLDGVPPAEAWIQMQLAHMHWIRQLEKRQEELDPIWSVTAAVLRENMSSCMLISGGE